jgi:hypothetical protein
VNLPGTANTFGAMLSYSSRSCGNEVSRAFVRGVVRIVNQSNQSVQSIRKSDKTAQQARRSDKAWLNAQAML